MKSCLECGQGLEPRFEKRNFLLGRYFDTTPSITKLLDNLICACGRPICHVTPAGVTGFDKVHSVSIHPGSDPIVFGRPGLVDGSVKII
jgi:hypothetical protein